MGDPRKQRKKYSGPMHPWQGERIEEEKILLKDFGLKNKKEIWKMGSLLRNFSRQAKRLIAMPTEQSELEKTQLMKKLSSLGLITETAKLEDVLAITLRDLLERRLQTLVYRKNLSKTIKQARQFIVHEHIIVGDKKITIPSCLVRAEEESLIKFTGTSPLSNPEHVERAKAETKKEVKPKKEEKFKHRGKKEFKKRWKKEEGKAPKEKKSKKEPKKEAPKEEGKE